MLTSSTYQAVQRDKVPKDLLARAERGQVCTSYASVPALETWKSLSLLTVGECSREYGHLHWRFCFSAVYPSQTSAQLLKSSSTPVRIRPWPLAGIPFICAPAVGQHVDVFWSIFLVSSLVSLVGICGIPAQVPFWRAVAVCRTFALVGCSGSVFLKRVNPALGTG